MSVRGAPWWLVGGTEQCPFCLQRYAAEVEVRCVGCDRGLCVHCVGSVEVRAERRVQLEEVWCPECAAAREQRGRGDVSAAGAGSAADREDA